MKKYTLLFASLFLLGTFGISAMSVDNIKPTPDKAIVSQIYAMLGEHAIPDGIRGAKAEVRVGVDSGNYLRILSIETENDQFKDFIKTSIDFQKLRKGSFKQGIVYRIPLEVRE